MYNKSIYSNNAIGKSYHANGNTNFFGLSKHISLRSVFCYNINNQTVIWLPFENQVTDLIKVAGDVIQSNRYHPSKSKAIILARGGKGKKNRASNLLVISYSVEHNDTKS